MTDKLNARRAGTPSSRFATQWSGFREALTENIGTFAAIGPNADSAGIVLGARVPVVLTSRADTVRARMASCAVRNLYAHGRRANTALPAA